MKKTGMLTRDSMCLAAELVSISLALIAPVPRQIINSNLVTISVRNKLHCITFVMLHNNTWVLYSILKWLNQILLSILSNSVNNSNSKSYQSYIYNCSMKRIPSLSILTAIFQVSLG